MAGLRVLSLITVDFRQFSRFLDDLVGNLAKKSQKSEKSRKKSLTLCSR